MSLLRNEVLKFVKAHDLNTQNDKAEKILEADATPHLAKQFSVEILRGKNASSFHEANETLFEYIPPSKRDQFLKWLSESCNRIESALCRQGELPPYSQTLHPSTSGTGYEEVIQRENDIRKTGALEPLKDLDKIPSISENRYPAIYKKFTWLIEHAKKQGEREFANTLEMALQKENLKYLPDLKVANAYADPRKSGVIVFGKKFFERIWADEIQGVDGKPIQISDEKILQYFNGVENFGKEQDSPSISYSSLQETEMPKDQIEETRQRLKQETLKDQKSRYAYYFGNLPINTFPRNMPSWIILVAHEVRHTMQLAQDKSDWNPKWAQGKGIKGLAYYTTLGRLSNSRQKDDPSSGKSGGSMFILGKEADTTKRMENIGSVREREATTYGVRIAKKLVGDWAREQTKP